MNTRVHETPPGHAHHGQKEEEGQALIASTAFAGCASGLHGGTFAEPRVKEDFYNAFTNMNSQYSESVSVDFSRLKKSMNGATRLL